MCQLSYMTLSNMSYAGSTGGAAKCQRASGLSFNTRVVSGKSTLATNIAVQAEAAGKPVLLVDLDPSRARRLWGQLRGNKKPTVFEGRPDKLTEIVARRQRSAWPLSSRHPLQERRRHTCGRPGRRLIVCPVMVDLFSLAGLQDTAKVIEMAGKLSATVGRAQRSG